MKRIKLSLSFVGLLSALCLAPLMTGCAAEPGDEDDAASVEGANTSNPTYDAVVRGATKVETSSARTADQSASTTLLGFMPGASPEAALDRLFEVGAWKEIRDADGEQPFTKATVKSDTTVNGVRTIAVKLELDGGVTLDVAGTAKETTKGIVVHLENTSAYKHWLAGTILEAKKLSIDVELVKYQGGVIVDAKMKAKLKKMEDKAPKLTGSIALIFDWLKKTTG